MFYNLTLYTILTIDKVGLNFFLAQLKRLLAYLHFSNHCLASGIACPLPSLLKMVCFAYVKKVGCASVYYVVYCCWQLSPWIACSTHVLSEDTVCRRVIGSKLYSTRLLTKKNNYKLPHWAERFLPASKDICIVEESVIDRKNKTLTTYTRNIVMTRVMVRYVMIGRSLQVKLIQNILQETYQAPIIVGCHIAQYEF